MINVQSLYNDVADVVNKSENSYLDFDMFNRMSRRGEIRLLDWLTGKVTGQEPPQYLQNQKNKDWISPLIKPFKTILSADGTITKPDDYYYYDNLFELNLNTTGCEDDDSNCEDVVASPRVGKYIIDVLSGDRYTQRINTYIKGLKPRPKRAVAKEIGNTFEITPAGLQGVVLEYVSLPVFGFIVTKEDAEFNDVIIDEAASTNYSWPEQARESLIYFISDAFVNFITSASGKQFNNSSNADKVGK